MGKCYSVYDDSEWTFVGREEDIEHVKKLLQEQKSILISGLPKIGKTKFIEKIYTQFKDNKKCIWKDFELDDIDDGDDVYDWFIKFLTEINDNEEKPRIEKNFPLKFYVCGTCDKCKNLEPNLCSQKNKMIKKAINTIIAMLKKDGKEIVLFFDNVDKVMNSSLKDNFLHFLQQSVKQTKLRTVIASGIKPILTAKGFESYKLEPVNDQAIRKLFYETCERRELCPENDEEALHKVKYSSECLVFKPENKRYIDAIVKLCEGLPLAAIMSGMLLTKDEGLFTPVIVVEILICLRLTSLSPDVCPPEDRLNIYNCPMEEVNGVASYFISLNEELDVTTFSIETAFSVAIYAQEGTDTEAKAKLKVLKKALDRAMLSIPRLSGHQLTWHCIFQRSQDVLQTLNTLPSDKSVSEVKEMVFKFMKENFIKAGLDFDDDILRDPMSLKQAIESLSIYTPVTEAMAKLKYFLEMSTICEFICKMNDDGMCAILNDLMSVINEDEKIRDYRTRTGGEKLLQNPSYNIQKMFMSCLHEMPESENIQLCLQDFFIDENTEHSEQLQRMLKSNKTNIKSLYIDTSRTSWSLREIIDLFSLSDLSHIQKLYYRGDWKNNAEINLILFPSLQSVTLLDSEWTNDKENLSENFARLQNLQYLYMFNFTLSHKILETFFNFISGQKSMKELTLYMLNCKKHGRHDCKRWNLDFSKHSTLTKVNLKMLPTLQLDIKTPSLVNITLLDINLDKSSLLLSGEMLNIERVKLFAIEMSAGSLQNFITVLENLPQTVTVTMDDIKPETEYKRVKENIRRSQTFHVIEDDTLPGAFEFKS